MLPRIPAGIENDDSICSDHVRAERARPGGDEHESSAHVVLVIELGLDVVSLARHHRAVDDHVVESLVPAPGLAFWLQNGGVSILRIDTFSTSITYSLFKDTCIVGAPPKCSSYQIHYSGHLKKYFMMFFKACRVDLTLI